MKVLVTGGAGFIGSHIVDALIERGDDVVVVDDLSTGFASNVNPEARLCRLSITDPGLADVFEQERPDVVSHHAAQVNLRRSADDPLFDAQVNILGSINIIVNCVRLGVRRLLYASSGGAVYGEPQYLPVDENHVSNPLSQYGVSKRAVEHYLHSYAQYGLNYVALRYSNVYGPRQNPKGEAGVVAIFSEQMLQGVRPTIFGPGNKTRDYAHVSDVVQAHLLAMDRGNNTTYNIGTGVETSDQQVFDAVAETLGYRDSPLYTSVRHGEIQRICLDCSKARRELSWSPRLSFKEGVQVTVPYYRCQGAHR